MQLSQQTKLSQDVCRYGCWSFLLHFFSWHCNLILVHSVFILLCSLKSTHKRNGICSGSNPGFLSFYILRLCDGVFVPFILLGWPYGPSRMLFEDDKHNRLAGSPVSCKINWSRWIWGKRPEGSTFVSVLTFLTEWAYGPNWAHLVNPIH